MYIKQLKNYFIEKNKKHNINFKDLNINLDKSHKFQKLIIHKI